MKKLITTLVISMTLIGCSSRKLMSKGQKRDSIVSYYENFSYGLKLATNLLDPNKQVLANAAISLADVAINQLKDYHFTNEQILETQAKIDSANAVVGAANG